MPSFRKKKAPANEYAFTLPRQTPGVHPNFSASQAARFSGRWRQKSFQVPLRRWAMGDVITKLYEWFGYKFHLLVDVKHEVIMAWKVT
jgi:hypothetical protein